METKAVSITVDVHCHWTDSPPRYRVYVDNDLLTERTFIWPGYQNFVRENIHVNLNPGQHELKIVNVDPRFGKFEARNIIVNKIPAETTFVVN